MRQLGGRSLLTTWRIFRGRQSALVRPGDRIDAGLRLGLVPLVLLVAVGAAVAAFVALHGGQARERAELASLHPVASTVRSVAGVTTASPSDPVAAEAWAVDVSWRTPAGTTRTASVVALHQPVPGHRMTIWLDRAGRPTATLWTATDTQASAAFAGLAALILGVALVGSGTGLVRRGLARKRLAEWSDEWKRVAPTWTTH